MTILASISRLGRDPYACAYADQWIREHKQNSLNAAREAWLLAYDAYLARAEWGQ